MKKTLLALSIGTALSTAAYAQPTHQMELTVDAGRSANTSVDTQITDIQQTMYFSPVASNSAPLLETAFIEKASSASIGYQFDESEFDGSDEDRQVDTLNFGVRYIPQNTNLLLGYSRTQIDSERADIESDADRQDIELGAYISDSSLLSLTYSEFDDNVSADAITRGIKYKSVAELNNGMDLSTTVGYSETDFGKTDADSWNLDAMVFPDRTLGLGVVYETTSTELAVNSDADQRSHTYGVQVSKFFNTNFEVSGKVLNHEIEDNNTDESTQYLVGMNYRF